MIPRIDPRVRHVGTTFLRTLTAAALKALDGAIVVSDNERQLAVILPFETYLRMQEAIQDGETVVKPGFVHGAQDIDIELSRRRSSGKGTETRGIRQKGDGKR